MPSPTLVPWRSDLAGARWLAGIVLLLGSCFVCAGQSHDPNKPTALGPGVNKGNIDNMQNGPNYYYFLAGPGHVDLHYAFHEMGVFGNPLRQVLNFDVLDEKGKVISHDAIQSMGKLERLTQAGNVTSPVKLVIRLTSPDALVRLGGYYEIEVVGAARFEGKTTGGNIKPVDTSLVRPGSVALTTGPVSLSGPAVSLTSGAPVSLYQPVGALSSVQESPKELRLTLAADILFDFDKATIRPDAQAALDRVTEIIRRNGKGAVRIEGFTDAKGATDYNLRLSSVRAESVEKWLVERGGLRGTGFEARGLGASRFVAPNVKRDGSDDPAGRQKNRRVEIVIQRKS
jgi:outer membrane protein OmpA-like peptidoglycan-associated protein